MKVTALVLLCSLATVQTPDGVDGRLCTPDTARDVIVAPEATDIAGCMFQSMAYVADTMPERVEGSFIRVLCTPGGRG